MNLNTILQMQSGFMAQGLVLSDQAKMYNTLDKLVTEVGLKDVNRYFNNPEVPQETLQAQLEQAVQMVKQLQMQIQQNPLADAEKIRAQAKLIEADSKQNIEAAKLEQQARIHAADNAIKLTDLELKYSTDVPGSVV